MNIKKWGRRLKENIIDIGSDELKQADWVRMYDEYKELGPETGKREQLREIGGLKLNRKISASVLTLFRDFYTN